MGKLKFKSFIMAKKERLPIEQAYENWVNCLIGNDPNSIFRQITLMIWETSVFRIIFEARKIQLAKSHESPMLNGALHSFIDRNYFQVQCAFIRRLTDKAPLTGDLGVYSITALINDIKNYKAEFTRETYLRLRKMPFDYSEIRIRANEFFRNQPPGKAFFVPSELDWELIEEAHQIFDRLSGVSPAERKPVDQIADHVFSRLQERLSASRKIKKYVDKFVAHSATPESRSIYDENNSVITLKQIWEAQKSLFEVADFISVVLFSEDHMALAFENPDFFEFWDVPLVDSEASYIIGKTLENYRKETQSWNFSGIDNVWRWLEEKEE